MSQTGHCHCKQIEFTVKLNDKTHILCRCDTCKKLGGGTFSLNQIVPKENLKITKGSPKTYTYYGASGKPVNCFFCSNCTSHIYHHQAIMGNDIVVRTILLDDGKNFPPGGEIFGEGKLGWEKDVDFKPTSKL